jgi:hypothetical protein
MSRGPAARIFAAAAAGIAAAAIALRGRRARPRDPLEALGGAWAAVASGPGERPVEVALVVARARSGLLGRPSFELALRTKEELGGSPLERSTAGERLDDSSVVARRPQGAVVLECRDLRLELDPARPDEVRLVGSRYWRAPDFDLEVTLKRVLEVAR